MDLEWLKDRKTCPQQCLCQQRGSWESFLYAGCFLHWMKLFQTPAPLGCGLSAPPGYMGQLRPHLGSKEKQKSEQRLKSIATFHINKARETK